VSIVKSHGQASPGITAISQVIEFFTTTFLGPIYATGITLLYYDQRVRKEGFDIEWMMQAAGLTVPAPVQQDTLTAPQLESQYEPALPAPPPALEEPPPAADPEPAPEPTDPEQPHE
jgi:hypothetical protein